MKAREPFSRIKGFTLIEILIVTLIIISLIAIMIPVVGTMREKARAAATRERFATIGTGLETYKTDFGYYPPSAPGTFKGVATTPVNANTNNKNLLLNSGSAMLAEALLGYLPYEFDGAGTLSPLSGQDKDDFGFRKNVGGRGNRYGPYTDAMAVPLLSGSGSGNIRIEDVPTYSSVTTPATNCKRMVYLDAYGNEILYYRSTDVLNPTNVFGTSTNAIYVNSDNALKGTASFVLGTDSLDPAANGTAAFFNSMHAGSANTGAGSTPSNTLGRGGYVLISAHRDGTYFNDDDIVGPLR
jgi:type II secretory pathway pseudopilin PulG